MSGLLGKPKVDKPVSVDPADVENRRGLARLRRLASGGSVSTIMSEGMAGVSSAPRATLTGLG